MPSGTSLRTKEELGQLINAEGGMGEYIATYAGREGFRGFAVSDNLVHSFERAWDAVQSLIDLAEEEGIFGEEV